MKAAILTLGTELTRGELVDQNGAWLADELTSLGLDVLAQLTVDDDRERIERALGGLAPEVDVVVATGGLGPTSDDLTAESVASLLGEPLIRHHDVIDRIQQLWRSRGREMPPSNAKQADLPESAQILPNPVGTAPGFRVTIEGADAFFMPGVPREMRRIFTDSVAPALAPRVSRRSHQIHLRTFGRSESDLADALTGVEEAYPGVTLGYRAHFPEIELKVLARAGDELASERLAAEAAAELHRRLGDAIFGDRDDTFPGVVGRELRDRGLTLALAESCTGGLVGAKLTSVPGSSDFLLFDAVVYANSAKEKVLGVSPETLRGYGAVSGEAAAQMAEGARRIVDADLAVSITGVAGPGGGTDEKPVGTVWFGLARRDRPTHSFVRDLHMFGDRERIRELAAYVAMECVRRAAHGRPLPGESRH